MNENKPTFFTSDWHLGHEKVLEFDKRPFKDVDHMHRVLINSYNASISPDGICYHLGDVGFQNIELTKSILSQLNGTKILILGNHDRSVTAMYKLGFHAVMYSATLYIAQERVTLTHCPLLGVSRENVKLQKNHTEGENWHGELSPKYAKFTVKNEGQFHLHGHIHSRIDKPNSKKIQGRQFDIGVPANNYRPVSIGEIEQWITFTKRLEAESGVA